MKVDYLKPGLYYVKSGNQYKQVKIERVKLEFDFNLDEIKERYCGVSGGYNRNELFIDDNGKFPAIPKDVVSTTCYPKINGYAMVDGEIKEVKNASTIIDINEKNEKRETLIWQKTDGDVKAYYDIDVYLGEDICRESQSYELVDIEGNKTYRKGLIAEARLTDEQKEILNKAVSMISEAGITIVTDYEYGGAYAFNNRNVYSHIEYGPDMEDNEFGAPIREFGHKISELKTIAEGCEDVIVLERK